MAAQPLDYTSALPVLKQWYNERTVTNLTYRNRPLFGWIPKRTGVGGESYEIPVRIANIAGAASDFSNAVDSRGPTQHLRWSNKHIRNYATATLDYMTIELMKNDRGAFLRAITTEIDSAFETVANDIAHGLYRTSDGVRGRVIPGGPAGAVIEFVDHRDARAFYVNMRINAAATKTGAIRADEPRVVAVDKAAGTITVSAIGTIVADDYIFRAGDAADTGAVKKLSGFGDWFEDPATITSTPFKSIDRTVSLHQLAGLRYDGTSNTTEDSIVLAAADVFENEGMPDACFVHPVRMADLDRDLEQRGRFDKVMSTSGDIGFSSLKIHTGAGVIDVIADPWCPIDNGYLLEKRSLELFSTGRLPDFVSKDGDRLHRIETADEIEFRIGGYYDFACYAPGHNSVIDFAAL